MYKHKGFTLIELLVVIAIIGILSTVVLVSLSNAKQKGNDAAVKANLDSAKKQMELYYATNGNYGGVFFGTQYRPRCPVLNNSYTAFNGTMFDPNTDTVFYSALMEALKNGKPAINISYNDFTVCRVAPYVAPPANQVPTTSWVIAVTFKDGQRSWCVDSSGVAKEYPGVADLAVVNPAPPGSDAKCK